MLLLARTTPLEEVKGPRDGLSLFYTRLDRSTIEVREIEKLGRKAVDSNQLFIDGLRVPLEDRIGEEGKGFDYILHGMNPERVPLAAEAIGLGRGGAHARGCLCQGADRVDRPIGMNQGIQHPLAERWMELEAADLMMLKAAWLYDQGQPCGAEANAASIWGPKPASAPARPRSSPTAAWATRRNSTSNAISARPCCRASRRSVRSSFSASLRKKFWDCPSPIEYRRRYRATFRVACGAPGCAVGKIGNMSARRRRRRHLLRCCGRQAAANIAIVPLDRINRTETK